MKNRLIKWLSIFSIALILIGSLTLANYRLGFSFEYDNFPLENQWSSSLKGSIEGISTVDGQVVFVRTSSKIYALELETGHPLWHHDLAWQAIPEPAISSNGIVFFADGDAIWGINQSNGAVLWQQPVSKPDRHVKDTNDNLLAVEVGEHLNIYNAYNGSLLWSKPVCRNNIQAHIYKNIVYVPCYGIRAIDISTGEDRWESKDREKISKVAYDDDVMYYSPDQVSVVAFDLQNRTELWRTSLSSEGYTQFKIVENIVFSTDSNQFCALDKKDGVVLWCVRINGPQNPTVIGDTAYIFDGYHKEIIAIDVLDGREIGRLTSKKFSVFAVSKQLMSSSDELLIFGIGNKVFAFGK